MCGECLKVIVVAAAAAVPSSVKVSTTDLWKLVWPDLARKYNILVLPY